MARHYYNIEVVAPEWLDEDEINDVEIAILEKLPEGSRLTTEYVDSEG